MVVALRMFSTTTYARRHRQRNKNNIGIGITDIDVPEPNGKHHSISSSPPKKRRRSLPEDTKINGKPRKKSKSSQTKLASPLMSVHSFQTPLPTFHTLSQVYKLPSSSPKDTPGLLSPVPVVSQATLTSSKKLKENQPRRSAKGNKTWRTSKHGDSSKTLRSSVTLPSGSFCPDDASGPALHNHPYTHDRSRSTSRSSSNSSTISTTLKDSQKFYSTLKYSQSLTSLKLDGRSKRRQNRKHKFSKTKRSILPLASPFVSRSSSPAKAFDNAHISEESFSIPASDYSAMGPPPLHSEIGVGPMDSESDMRTGFSNAFLDQNIPVRQHRNTSGRPTQGARNTSPYKMAKSVSRLQRENIVSKFKPKSQLGIEIDALVPALEQVRNVQKRRKAEEKHRASSGRERRTSAPSTVQLPRPQQKSVVGTAASRPIGGASSHDEGLAMPRKIWLGTGLDIVVDSRSYHAHGKLSSGEGEEQGHFSQRSHSPLEWMQTRGSIDFNRPPSQMSFDSGYRFEYPDVEAIDGFTSSEEDMDEDDRLGREEEGGKHGRTVTRGRAPIATGRDTHRLGVPFSMDMASALSKFGDDVLAMSTPFKDALVDMKLKANGKPRARLDLADNGYETDLNVVASVKKRRLEQGKQKSYEHGSTPIFRTSSLPNLKSSPPDSTTVSSSLGLGSSAHIGFKRWIALQAGEAKGEVAEERDEDENGEKDMDLTGNDSAAMVLTVEATLASKPKRRQDMTSWITDSIISPPTGYMQWAIKKGGDRESVTNSDGDTDARSIQGSEGMNQHRSGQILGQLHMNLDSGKKGEDVVDETTCGGQTLETRGETTAQQVQCELRLSNESSENTATSAAQEHVHNSANTKRTRSGTIVPINAPIPPGTRRTRGGTIVGPLPVAAPTSPLPSVPIGKSKIGQDSGVIPDVGAAATRRSRSGTITAAGSVGIVDERTRGGSVQRLNGKATASFLDGDHIISNQQQRFGDAVHDRHNDTEQDVPGIEASANEYQAQMVEEYETDIECYVDSMYLPPLTSSPDPIDFLRFASIVEEDEDNFTEFGSALGTIGTKEIAWRVAEDPPSPEVVKKRGNKIFRGMGFGGGKGWSLTRRSGGRKQKAQHKKAKFTDDIADGEEADEEINRNGDTEMSDDELLLLPGAMGELGQLR
ncbi:hypothetical protein JR316_0008293 [Psilocybe cubensis]|uniref:Uncharacterized protein n=2 Tax=Psilocybe cubensis TaxID=181762 RepID=A0A8H8CJ62_PSICU|nr:hypothetical protein JR316_0008293 [Psilocybe cubensis]KAH9479698.1 hypothetical protein JR316_0008293 [Psilocybe cubensis]